jgi:uncharacterized membrane protein
MALKDRIKTFFLVLVPVAFVTLIIFFMIFFWWKTSLESSLVTLSEEKSNLEYAINRTQYQSAELIQNKKSSRHGETD